MNNHKNINEIDLHLQYKMETGHDHKWVYWNSPKYSNPFRSDEQRYSWDYTEWLEAKHLALLNLINSTGSIS